MDKDKSEAIHERLAIDTIAEALDTFLEQEGETALDDRCQYIDNPDYRLTPEMDKRLAKLVAHWTKAKTYHRIQLRGLLVAALIVSLLLATQAGAIQTVISNYFLISGDQSIDFANRSDPNHSYNLQLSIAMPQSIPVGFKEYEDQRINLRDYTAFIYLNNAGEKIEYIVYADKTSVRLDWKDDARYEEMEINGLPGGCVIYDGYCTLFWGREPPQELRGPAHLYDALLHMAESVSFPD